MASPQHLLPDAWSFEGRTPPICQDGRRYLIGGEICEWDGPSIPIESCVFSCENGEVTRPHLGESARLDGETALLALKATHDAWGQGQGDWPTRTVSQRIEAMEAFLFRMREVRAPVIDRMMWEIGKSEPDSAKEFDRTVEYIVDTIEALKNLDRGSSGFSVEKGFFAQVRRSPFGPTLCMGPYNYPLNETFTTLIPALIMGNPVISKLPRFGLLLNQPLLEAFRDCFPPGAVNIISGDGQEIVTPLMQSGEIELLALIGSSHTADKVKSEHPFPHRLKSILSLDAKNPGIVLEDADLKVAIPQIIAGALSFNGQRCTALKIIFVHRSRRVEFLEALCQAVDHLKAGTPWKAGVNVTPMADPKAVPWLKELISDAQSKGAEVVNLNGGESIENFMHPAVIFPVKPGMEIYDVEQFGPIIPVVEFEDPSEVRKYIVESRFGMQVSIFGYDPKVLGPMIDVLVNQVSRVNLNTQCQRGPDTFPFTGRKASAEGTLSVTDALRRFSIRTLVATDYTGANRDLVNAILSARTSNFLRTDFIF